ncbi:signal peptidase I [Tengunoibacter tsumagoiensis]|uniref:Signal peptidase I n=1 Tax=Tengunoibacter tsumagoiensis TaxID=2014871 RepID=A0A401ZWJ8_9CHLR|nr:signal peptidase I [Tengunoibacter tsumagoiensis]
MIRDIIEIVAITVLVFIVLHFTIQSYNGDGITMQPGLAKNEYVMVNKVAYKFKAPERGDVIVFNNPHDTTKVFIKRIIGLPGDTVTLDNTHVSVNGTQLTESYVKTPFNPEGKSVKVPANQYFVVDDNRQTTDDSRIYNWGYVPKDFIIGKAVLSFWPLNHVHFINTYPDVYAHIKTK